MATQTPSVHPEVEKILQFEIPARKLRADLRPEGGGGLLLGDLIEVADIRFDQRTGKPMMLHGGILSICDGIGVEYFPPTIEKTGEKEYQATVGIKFGDGSVFYATGEASTSNTSDRELSGKFPVNQTHIRALNKAVVRALGLYRVLLTEEEADEFKTPQVIKLQQEYEATLQQMSQKIQKANSKEERLVKVISGMMEVVALPADDPKYPHAYLVDIKEDTAYLEELKKGENKIIGFVANQLLKEIANESSNEAPNETQKFEAEEDPLYVKPTHEEKMEQAMETEVEAENAEDNAPTPSTQTADAPITEEEQEAFLRELQEGQDTILQELEQAAIETSAANMPPASVQLEIDEEGNVIEPR